MTESKLPLATLPRARWRETTLPISQLLVLLKPESGTRSPPWRDFMSSAGTTSSSFQICRLPFIPSDGLPALLTLPLANVAPTTPTAARSGRARAALRLTVKGTCRWAIEVRSPFRGYREDPHYAIDSRRFKRARYHGPPAARFRPASDRAGMADHESVRQSPLRAPTVPARDSKPAAARFLSCPARRRSDLPDRPRPRRPLQGPSRPPLDLRRLARPRRCLHPGARRRPHRHHRRSPH